MQNTEIDNTYPKLSLIFGHARRDRNLQFTSLAHLLDVKYLRDCYYSLNRNKAVGIDNVSWQEYGAALEENLEQLVSRLKCKRYKPIPARRVYIPKNETEMRPLGISALENKIVERGITRILESIYEQDFLDCSYGFRRKRNCHQALESLDKFCLKQGSGFFKFFDLRLKFSDLEIGKVHGKLKDVNAFAKISSFRQNRIGRFAFKKYAEFVERAKRMLDPVAIMVLFFMPAHGVFPNINIVTTSKHKETHSAWSPAECSGWYL